MGTEVPKDPLKGVDWKAIGTELQKDPSAGAKPIVKKRLPKKIRQIPDYYFLPRRSLPSVIAFYGSCIAGGIGAGMLLEIWMNKKIKGISWISVFFCVTFQGRLDRPFYKVLVNTCTLYNIKRKPFRYVYLKVSSIMETDF